MNRRFLLATSLLAAPTILSASKSKDEPLIIGHGTHRYRVEKDWSQADHEKFPLKSCHEMVQAKDGRLFLLTNHQQNNILIYDKSGQLLDAWTLDLKGAHGLTIAREGEKEFLYIADPSAEKVVKTTLEGEVLLALGTAREVKAYRSKELYRPTETAVAPNGDIYVIDGYGSQFILHFDKTGKFLKKFGGKSSQAIAKGKFLQAHGIALDTRGPEPLLACTARIRNELCWYDLAGNWVRTVYLPGAYLSRPVISGKHLYSAVCFGAKKNDFRMWQGQGYSLILDENDQVISCPGAHQPRYEEGQLLPLLKKEDVVNNGHDVCVDDNEDLYLCQWNSGKVPPYKFHRI